MLRSNSRIVVCIAALAFFALLPLALASLTRSFPIDFTAFWCAGNGVLAHQNPYLEGTIHDCEVLRGLAPALTVPVPYPPYAMLLFAAFATVPEPAAFAIWSVLSAVATIGFAQALRRLTSLPLAFCLAAATAAVFVESLPLGQVTPAAVCCFAWALVFIRERRATAAALALAGTAVMPNFALAAWIAAFCCLPFLRFRLTIAGALLAAAAVLATGPDVALTYVRDVLPAHAKSEASGFGQLGTVALLHLAGLPRAAIPVCTAAILALAIAFGIVAGIKLARRYAGDHWVVACATAMGVAGSPFVHGRDVSFALPFVLMLYSATPQMLTATASALTIAPWSVLAAVDVGGAQAAIAFPPLLIAFDFLTGSRLVLTLSSLTATALFSFAVVTYGGRRVPLAQVRPAAPAPARTALAEERWQHALEAAQAPEGLWIMRAMVYGSYLVMIFASARATRIAYVPSVTLMR